MVNFISQTQDFVSFKKKLVFNAGACSSLDYANPQKNIASKVELLVSPFGLPFVPIEIVGSDVGRIITKATWTKDRDNPAGSLSLNIAPDENMINDIFYTFKKIPLAGTFIKLWQEFGFDLRDLLKPQTLVQYWEDGYHTCTGTVVSCKRMKATTNDSSEVSYSVTINELGHHYTKNLIRCDTFQLSGIEQNMLDSMNKAFELANDIKFMPLSTGLKMLVNAFTASTLSDQGMCLSDGFPLALRLLALPFPMGAISNSSFASSITCGLDMFSTGDGSSFWDYLKGFIPSPFMEFFTESGGRTMVTENYGVPSVLLPGFNYLVARSVPYSNPLIGTVNPAYFLNVIPFELSVLNLLAGGDFIIITDDDIIDKELGQDCTDQATSFRANFGAGASTTSAYVDDKPIVATGPLNPLAGGGVDTYGVIEMVEEVNCVQMYEAGVAFDTPLTSLLTKTFGSVPLGVPAKGALANLLCTWFRNKSKFNEGTVTIKKKAWARVGMYCLYLPSMSGAKVDSVRDIGIYYISKLDQEYGIQNDSISATTKLTLVRGVPLPSSLARTALLLFDYEIIPPDSGLLDGQTKMLLEIRRALRSMLKL